jgi:hypothetical protein
MSKKMPKKSTKKSLFIKNNPEPEPKPKPPVIEEEDCVICNDVLDHGKNPKKPLKILKKINGMCGHEFHKECINKWMNSGQQAAAHQCPICRTDISPDQWPRQIPQLQQPQPQQFQEEEDEEDEEEEEPQIPEHQIRLQQVIDYETEQQRAVPFLGVVVCYNNQIYKGYLNTDFNLGTNNTFGELKALVLSEQNDIVSSLPRDFVCNARNFANTVTMGWVPTVTRQIGIREVYFTTPSRCSVRGLSDIIVNNDDLPLGVIYRTYQEFCPEFSVSPFVRSVYENYTRRWDRTGPEDPGIHRTNYFLDPNGPDIPEQFRPENAEADEVKASRNSIAWLCFNIDCVRRGGKTRKNKKRKQTKRRNSRFLKNRKSNKKKSN